MDLDSITSIDWETFDLWNSPLDPGFQQSEDLFEDYFDPQNAAEWPALTFAQAPENPLGPEQYLEMDPTSHDVLLLSQNHTPTITSQTSDPLPFHTAQDMSDKVLVPSIAKGRPGKRANPSSNLMNTSNKKRALCKGDREVLEGYFCFPLNSDGPTFQPRSPYTASKKAEVNEMRDIGACLRCQRLKKLCPKGTPCQRCINAAQSTRSSRALRWMDCVRPSLESLSIFKHDDTKWESNESRSRFKLFINEYRKADVSLAFDVPFDWNVQSMSRFFAKWVVDNDQAQELSVVGIMSTTNFASILSTLVGTRVSELSKAFIYSVSCLRNVDLPPQAARYVLAVANCVGAEVIRELDALVSVRNLAKLSQPKLFGLFALLLATIIAVQYSDERVSENHGYTATFNTWERNALKRDQLTKILTYYMILVGQTSGILASDFNENDVVGNAKLLWKKSSCWSWQPLEQLLEGAVGEADEAIPGLRITATELSPLSYEERFASQAASLWFPYCNEHHNDPRAETVQPYLSTLLDCQEPLRRATSQGSLWELGGFGQGDERFQDQFYRHTPLPSDAGIECLDPVNQNKRPARKRARLSRVPNKDDDQFLEPLQCTYHKEDSWRKYPDPYSIADICQTTKTAETKCLTDISPGDVLQIFNCCHNGSLPARRSWDRLLHLKDKDSIVMEPMKSTHSSPNENIYESRSRSEFLPLPQVLANCDSSGLSDDDFGGFQWDFGEHNEAGPFHGPYGELGTDRLLV